MPPLSDARALVEYYLNKDEHDGRFLDSRLFMAELTYNRLLKALTRRLGWARSLSSKMARFTHQRLLAEIPDPV